MHTLKNDLSFNGKFEACARCVDHCCTHIRYGKSATYIFLYPSDIRAIQDKLCLGVDFFVQYADGTVRMAFNNAGTCVFNSSSGCTLPEEIKPIACKLYPYCLILRDGECYIIRDILGCYNEYEWDDNLISISRLFHELSLYHAMEQNKLDDLGYAEGIGYKVVGKLLCLDDCNN